MYVVKNEGSWVLFTKSNYLLNRALLNQGLGVLKIENYNWNSTIVYHGIIASNLHIFCIFAPISYKAWDVEEAMKFNFHAHKKQTFL